MTRVDELINGYHRVQAAANRGTPGVYEIVLETMAHAISVQYRSIEQGAAAERWRQIERTHASPAAVLLRP